MVYSRCALSYFSQVTRMTIGPQPCAVESVVVQYTLSSDRVLNIVGLNRRTTETFHAQYFAEYRHLQHDTIIMGDFNLDCLDDSYKNFMMQLLPVITSYFTQLPQITAAHWITFTRLYLSTKFNAQSLNPTSRIINHLYVRS
jgi:hypothetical protein